MNENDSQLSVQINDYDSYQAVPTKLDQGYSHVTQVPIIRIYGSLSVVDPKDDKSPKLVFNCMIHVHNFYPYIYVDCLETDYEVLTDPSHIPYITEYLEAALEKSFRFNRGNEDDNDFEDVVDNLGLNSTTTRVRKYIASVSIGAAVPIYGYQVGNKLFYKISLLSPAYKTRLIKLFNEKTLNLIQSTKKSLNHVQDYQVYEGHLLYLTQFLTDFNLFGCGWLNIMNAPGLYFRTPILNSSNYLSQPQLSHLKKFLQRFVTHDNVLFSNSDEVDQPGKYSRIGKSLLEIDISTNLITNRNDLKPRYIHDDFHEYYDFIKFTSSASKSQNHTQDRQIYLSSLIYVFNDLKYQCKQRNASFDSDTLANLHHSQLYGTGSTKWSNQEELDRLLQYVIKLNKPTNLSMEAFSRKRLNAKFKVSKETGMGTIVFPTCFELVDIDKNKSWHCFKLRHDADLLKWKSYTALFPSEPDSKKIPYTLLTSSEGSKEDSTTTGNESSRLLLNDEATKLILQLSFGDFTESVSVHDRTQTEESQSEKSDNDTDNMPLDIGSLDFVHKENDFDANSNLGNGFEEVSQLHELDDKILLQTQKKSQNDIPPVVINRHSSLQIPSSFDESLNLDASTSEIFYSQSSPTVSRYCFGNGVKSFEVLLPENLKKNNILKDLETQAILKIDYQVPYYENVNDVPLKPMIFANKKIPIPLKNETLRKILPMSSRIMGQMKSHNEIDLIKTQSQKLNMSWQFLLEPPLKLEMIKWLHDEEIRSKVKLEKFKSQIEPGITQEKNYKFSYNSEKVARKDDGFNNLTNFHMEIHCNTSEKDVFPDPSTDPITIIFYSFDDTNSMFTNCDNTTGILFLNETCCDSQIFDKFKTFMPPRVSIQLFDSEKLMVSNLIDLIEYFDPDSLSGYEVNANSWGYIIERFRIVYEANLLSTFGRGIFKSNGKFGDRWGYTHTSNIKLNGRHMLNIWRLLRSELSLTNYSLENVAYHLLHQSLPKHLNYELTTWLRGNEFLKMLFVFQHYLRRIELITKIIEVQELITRNVEHSRVIGIDFNANFYRGSQFKVESIFSRLTKQENMILNSPSKMDVHNMRSLECIPLILEPESNFYRSPLVVLDFQSLYPSIMIAYNYCYSTFLGRLHNYKPNCNTVGYLKHLRLPSGLVDLIHKHDGLNISPNGCMFVKSSIRKSILAKMLDELLNTRQAVKEVIKLFSDDAELSKLYDARQLALKLIANVTYGYTSATFSGRMPNSDIADAIVSSGREILMKSIEMIDSGDYGAKVVYGDTDSLFVYFPGKSRADAFELGRKIAATVTEMFPAPIKLKFEKVYHPCILLAKKRYVGYSFEKEDQIKPKFDAKGIETIRRDGIPAQQKMVEKTLRILFDTANVSKVKAYTLNQFHKILLNRISLNDFCFAKEVRYGTYKSKTHLPPGAIIAEKLVEKDPRREPQYRERVPYVVVFDPKKSRIKDRVMTPEDFMNSYLTDNPLVLDYEYYITRVLIPPIARVFNLIGADISAWYNELPKYSQLRMNGISMLNENFVTSYLASASCFICGANLVKNCGASNFICSRCSRNEIELISYITLRSKQMEQKILTTERVCELCVSHNFGALGTGSAQFFGGACSNRACSVYYRKFKLRNENSKLRERNSILLDGFNW